MPNWNTVDERNSANQLRLVVYPIVYRVLYIPGCDRRISGPSTVWESTQPKPVNSSLTEKSRNPRRQVIQCKLSSCAGERPKILETEIKDWS